MSISWKSFAGDTGTFAIEMVFIEDPDQGSAATPDEAASWGALRVWTGGRNITARTEAGETISAVHWYMLPVLEWWVENWDPLFHEERLPNVNGGDDATQALARTRFAPAGVPDENAFEWEENWQAWWGRHCMQAARSGGLFPAITFRRWQERVELSWRDDPVAGSPEGSRFSVPAGMERVPLGEVAGPVYEVLQAAAKRLSEAQPNSARVRSLLIGLAQLKEPTRLARRSGWIAGLGASADAVAQSWERLQEKLSLRSDRIQQALLGASSDGLVITRRPTAAQMFGSVSPMIVDEDVQQILDFLANSVADEGDSQAMRELVRDVPLDPAMPPADHGYLLAEETIEALEIDSSHKVDVRTVLERLGIGFAEVSLKDERIRGLSVAGPGFSPVIATNTTYQWSNEAVQRFTFAHEFCHLLFDTAAAQPIAVASGPWAPRAIEQRANAFAAMFLLPEEAVDRVIAADGSIESWSSVIRMGGALGASPSTVLEHLHNRGYIDDDAYERLRDPETRRMS